MSRGKEEQSFLGVLNEDVAGVLARSLSVNHILNLMSACNTTYRLFKPSLNSCLGMAQTWVVQGNPDELAKIAKHKPEALFERRQVTDLRGRIFPSISAYQRISSLFFCVMRT